jgi:EmrB/QacA subfamily drug resistance transporter
MIAADQHAVRAPAAGRSRWWILAAMVFGLFMPMLDNLVVNVAMPTIQRHLGAGISELQWIIDAYTLAFAAFMLTGGTLGDIYGRKRLFATGLAVFSLGSLACGLSSSIQELITFRVIQGTGGALILPGSLAIITSTFHGRERGAAIGIWSAVSGLAIAIGPLIGGYLVEYVNWQSIFFINVPIGVLALGLTFAVVPESKDTSSRRRLDIPGMLTGTLGLFFLVYATIEGNSRGWTSELILGAFALATVLLVSFVWMESRSSAPMLPLGFFRNRTFSAAVTVAACMLFSLFGVTFFFSLYLQNVKGYSPVGAGERLLPFTVMILLVAPIAGRLSDRFGSRWFIASGTLVLATGLALFLRVGPNSPYATMILPPMVVMSTGMALALSPMSAAVMGSQDESQAGIASAVQTTSQQVGGVFGVALLGALVTASFKRSFASTMASDGFPRSVVTLVLKKASRSASVGAISAAQAPAGTPSAVMAKIISAVHGSFVHAIHSALFVAIGFALLASALATLFIRSHVKRAEITSE